MNKRIVTGKNDAEEPVPVEVLAESIVAISQGIKKLRAGPLNDRCLEILIQEAAPPVRSPGRGYGKVSMQDLRAVMQGMESLEEKFIKRSPKAK